VSLDGVSLASGPSLPTTCSTGGSPSTTADLGATISAPALCADKESATTCRLAKQLCHIKNGKAMKDFCTTLLLTSCRKSLGICTHTNRSTALSSTRQKSGASANMEGCRLVRRKVVTTGLPHESVIGMHHRIIMGNTLQQRTCTLHGVVGFTIVDGVATAQLDPNLRDPASGSPLCFPLSAMIFFAGIVDSESSAIVRSVAVQIEPHGLIKVVAGSINAMRATKVLVRLDGITYSPFMPYNAVPRTCAPYCFSSATHGTTMGSSGCLKYCTPAQYIRHSANEIELNNCRCDMLKWLACFIYEGSSNLQCSQYKQLLRMHLLTPKREASQLECGKVCAEQLSAL